MTYAPEDSNAQQVSLKELLYKNTPLQWLEQGGNHNGLAGEVTWFFQIKTAVKVEIKTKEGYTLRLELYPEFKILRATVQKGEETVETETYPTNTREDFITYLREAYELLWKTYMGKNHPEAWIVYSTAIADGWLMLYHAATHVEGYVSDPTKEEWSEAFHSPSNPYIWTGGNQRIKVPGKTLLQFKVCPNYLKEKTLVVDPVRIFITDPESLFITGILGESGRRMIADGAPFIFTRPLAEKLIAQKVAILADNQENLQ